MSAKSGLSSARGVRVRDSREKYSVPMVRGIQGRSRKLPMTLELSSVTATVTVEQLAETFVGMGDENQAEFFMHMAKAFVKFRIADSTPFEDRVRKMGGHMQAAGIGERLGRLSPDAVELLRTMVEYTEDEIVKGVMQS